MLVSKTSFFLLSRTQEPFMPKVNLSNLTLSMSIWAFKWILPLISQDLYSIIYDKGHIYCPLPTYIIINTYGTEGKDHIHVVHHYIPNAGTEEFSKIRRVNKGIKISNSFPRFPTPSFFSFFLTANFFQELSIFIPFISIPHVPSPSHYSFSPRHYWSCSFYGHYQSPLLDSKDILVLLTLNLFVLFDTADQFPLKTFFYLGFHDVTLSWYYSWILGLFFFFLTSIYFTGTSSSVLKS